MTDAVYKHARVASGLVSPLAYWTVVLFKKKQGRQGRRADKEAIYSEQSQEGHIGVD